MKLTPTSVRTLSLKRGKVDATFPDDDVPGLGLRIREGGSRLWTFRYKIGQQFRRITIGSADAIPLPQARKLAADLHVAVRAGRDPAGERAEGKVRAAETMGAALALYLPYQQSRLKPGSYDEVSRHLAKHCRQLHGLQLAQIDRRAVAARMAAIAAESGNVAANRTRASLSAFFAWCVREGLTEQNPVMGTGKRPERARDRVLSLDELRAIWNALDPDDDYGRIVRLLMLTGQRANEIGGLRWDEIGGDEIVLPPARTKNSRRHVVPLSAPARAILDCRPRGEFVFGRDINRPFSGWSKPKERLDQHIKDATGEALPHWVVHDIRRSVATHLGDRGVQPHVIEAVLNHVSGTRAGIGAVYNKSFYDREKRQALDLWAAHLIAAVEGRDNKIVPMVRA